MLASNFKCKEDFSNALIKVRKFTKKEIATLNISYPDFYHSYSGSIGEYIEEFFSSFGKWGLMDRKGKMVTPTIYKKIYKLREGLAKVYIQKKGIGFINEKGEEIIPCEYFDTKDFIIIWLQFMMEKIGGL